jgi:hypothetical protein
MNIFKERGAVGTVEVTQHPAGANGGTENLYVSVSQRNQVLEEVAQAFDKMPFGDTAASFAVFVRDMKK